MFKNRPRAIVHATAKTLAPMLTMQLNDLIKFHVNNLLFTGLSLFPIIFMPNILNKLTCRPKKHSADKFDSSDPSYCQFLIKL